MMSDIDQGPDKSPRRGFFRAALPAGLGMAAGAAVSQAHAGPDDPLPQRFVNGKPVIPPLDTSILFARQLDSSDGITHEVLSLIQQEDGDNSFPWTVYAQLRTKHTGGDAVVFYARLHKDGPGWSCGVHSEVFAKNWGVGIGVNIEVANQYEGEEGFNGVIGLEMQSLGPKPAQSGVQIEGAGRYGTMVLLRGGADTGLDVPGDCGVGANLRQNSLRLDEGSWIELDEQGEVKMRYHKGAIEFYKGERRIAHLPVEAEDHEL